MHITVTFKPAVKTPPSVNYALTLLSYAWTITNTN